MAGISESGRDLTGGIGPVFKSGPPGFGDPATFGNASNKQGSDYDTIMSNYSKLYGSQPTSPISYNGSPDVNSAMGNLKELSTNGGFSDEAIGNIRARGLSPIRSIYANAQNNLDRQRSIQGGFSPGYSAATAKMARDQSSNISEQTGNINAGIAQMVAQNRLAASNPYASLASSEAGRGLDTSKFNSELTLQDRENRMRAAEGMRGLYGTTPALTNMFGGQVAEAARLGQGQQDINLRREQSTLANGMRMFG